MCKKLVVLKDIHTHAQVTARRYSRYNLFCDVAEKKSSELRIHNG